MACQTGSQQWHADAHCLRQAHGHQAALGQLLSCTNEYQLGGCRGRNLDDSSDERLQEWHECLLQVRTVYMR